MADRPYETRTVVAAIELRDGDTEAPVLTGYASTFNEPYQVGFFTEQIHPDAFKRTLSNTPDVRLLVDHEGQPLARTKSGTLQLTTDSRGLKVQAQLDPSDPDVQRLLPKMRRGDLDQMSFAFRVPADGDVWDYSGDAPSRTIREANLSGGDVSVVTYPANPATAVTVRAEDDAEAAFTFAYSMLTEARSGRKFDVTNLRRLHSAMVTLGFEMNAAESGANINDLPDSDFAYIEPGGEKDDEGKTTPRSLRHFPIQDAAHVRNALARAPQSPFGEKAMPKIKSAAKKFGIDVSEENSAHLQLLTRFFGDDEIRVAASVSYNDREQALSDALLAKFAATDDDNDAATDMWVVDASDTWVVWRQWGDMAPGIGLWRIGYTLGDDNTVTFGGDPQQVTASTMYTPTVQQNSARSLTLALREAEALKLRAARA